MKIKSFKQFLNEFEIEGENQSRKLSELEIVLKVAKGYGENTSHYDNYVFVEFFDTISLSDDRDVDRLYNKLDNMQDDGIISSIPLDMDVATDNNIYLQIVKRAFPHIDWNEPEAGSNILVIPTKYE